MSARYLVRLDDACPTMRAETWGPLEAVFDELGIRPVVGVIPDNRDPKLACSPQDPDFWSRVRRWQDKGWAVALHGLHHAYHPLPPGSRPILRLQEESEFAGLPLDVQKEKLARGYALMNGHGVAPRIFMAPSHTFDAETLVALRDVTDIRVIADGHALRVFDWAGFRWIPQQLWRFIQMPFGLWCICLHPNTMDAVALQRFIDDLRRHAAQFVDFDAAQQDAGPRSVLDHGFAAAFRLALKIKKSGRRD